MKDDDGNYYFDSSGAGITCGGFECVYLPLYSIFLVKNSVAAQGIEKQQELQSIFYHAGYSQKYQSFKDDTNRRPNR